MEPFISCYTGERMAGVDEVGRGPLAGDVVAAAVMLDASKVIAGLADSKKLSEKRREALFANIVDNCRSYCIARASVEEIDRLNIFQASMLAMKRAVEGLSDQPEHVLVDGNKIPHWRYAAECVIKGDSRVQAISAASILAKVTRDREMVELDKRYPGYGLALHKGYPTKAHLQALARLGPCEIHRRSFGPVRRQLEQLEMF